MALKVLIFALADWIGAARLPAAMQRAGFEVGVICPEGSLIGMTRYVNKRTHLRAPIQMRTIGNAIRKYVCEWGADAVVASDDISVAFLQDMTAQAIARRLEPEFSEPKFLDVLRRSLPLPEHFKTTRSKVASQAIAEQLGIPTSPLKVVRAVEDCVAFGAQHGYPVVLKPDRGSAGANVLACNDAPALIDAFQAFSATAQNLGDTEILAHAFVPGPFLEFGLVCKDGRVLTGLSRLKVKAYPRETSPSSVTQVIQEAVLSDAGTKLARHFHYNGFASVQFLRDTRDGIPKFLEFNPRPVPVMHMDERTIGIDWCQAWHRALNGQPQPKFMGPQVGKIIALFPQERRRDPKSEYLNGKYLEDVPKDDPKLVEGYLHHRH